MKNTNARAKVAAVLHGIRFIVSVCVFDYIFLKECIFFLLLFVCSCWVFFLFIHSKLTLPLLQVLPAEKEACDSFLSKFKGGFCIICVFIMCCLIYLPFILTCIWVLIFIISLFSLCRSDCSGQEGRAEDQSPRDAHRYSASSSAQWVGSSSCICVKSYYFN